MQLNAFDYHTDLTQYERRVVDQWLQRVLGDEWPKARVWRYEVIGEGVVQFHCFVVDGMSVDIDTFVRYVDTPPPVFR